MSENIYESPRLLAEYLLLHYGSAADVLGEMPGPVDAVDFPARLVRELLDSTRPGSDGRALDVGCAVGASSFALARHCREVIGIDFSHAFIRAANELRETGVHAYRKTVEGEIHEPSVARVPAGIERERTTFEPGDAMSLRDFGGDFDVVLAANLLCRLSDPDRFLSALPALVRTGGQLLITTPFTWLEDFTPPENWIGGTASEGRGFEALNRKLKPHFELEFRVDLPFLIREHARKFQYGVACGMRWQRR